MQDIVKKIIEIIRNNFSNGVRNDFIDINKVRKIYSANYSDENITQSFVVDIIRAHGIEDGGRFYFVSNDNLEDIRRFLGEILSLHSIAYYIKIYEKHLEFFVAMHIFSPEVLKKILQTTVGGHFYFSEFCSAKIATRLDYVIAQIFTMAGNSLSLDDLQEKLPYVPSEKILEILSDTKKYLPTNTGKYIPFSKIQFDTDEISVAKQQISLCIDRVGYAAPEDYDLSSNFALNPELAEKDLRNIICEKFFTADFVKRGKRLYKKGDTATKSDGVLNRLRKFIAEQSELPLAKIFAFDKDLAPNVALSAAYEQMIRVSENYFVKDSLITFDVDGVDEVLTPFVQGKIIPLRAVTSFTGFPPVEGYTWNLFLLESFLRKFSRRYVYAAPAVNSSNLGAIYPESMNFADYLDVQAAAIIQENIPLDKVAVENFLVGNGFRHRRINKATERIIARAKEMIDERHYNVRLQF